MKKSEIVKEIIESRSSIFPKDYSGEDIPQEVLEEILNSSNFAPNHKRTKPWRFRVFKGEEKLNLGKELQRLYKEITPEQLFLQKKFEDIGNKFSKSNVVLTVCVNFSGLVPEWEEIAATAMAVQNMHLTCAANNVGAYWGTPGMKDYLGEFLHLEENQKCYGLFFMGMIQN